MKKTIKRFTYFLSFIIPLILLTSCDTSGLDDFNDIQSKLFPNIWVFLTQLIVFLIMVVVIIFLFYKPIKKFLIKRKEYLQSELDSVSNEKKETISNYEKSKEIIKNSRVEASNILNNSKIEAELEKNKILEDASNEAINIKSEALNQIEKEKEKAKDEISQEIIDVAMDVSKHILSREISKEDNKKIIDNLLNDLEEK